MSSNPAQRIVVTGLGMVCPLGLGVEPVWARLIAGKSGLRRLPEEVVPDFDAKIGAVVPTRAEDPEGFDFDAVPVKDRKKMDRFIIFAMEAARQAIGQAGWDPQSEQDREDTATVVASGIGGFPVIIEAARTVETRGVKRLSPFTVPSFLVNLAAGQISIKYGYKGVLGAPVTACAASVQAIGDAMRLIRTGEAQIALCGGAEACVDRVSLGGFHAARALSTAFADDPQAASRPFDKKRDGFVMGEGAALMVIETLEHAQQRGATPLAELVGYGTSADAYHMAAAPESGEGAQRAMKRALAMAGIEPSKIGYINAHATSTPVGDLGELNAIRAVFGSGQGPAISSTKSATGHLLGAAGGLEAAFSVLALRDGILPPTLNLTEPDDAAEGLDLIGQEARTQQVDYVLSNGFGFGGVNAAVIFRRWEADRG